MNNNEQNPNAGLYQLGIIIAWIGAILIPLSSVILCLPILAVGLVMLLAGAWIVGIADDAK